MHHRSFSNDVVLKAIPSKCSIHVFAKTGDSNDRKLFFCEQNLFTTWKYALNKQQFNKSITALIGGDVLSCRVSSMGSPLPLVISNIYGTLWRNSTQDNIIESKAVAGICRWYLHHIEPPERIARKIFGTHKPTATNRQIHHGGRTITTSYHYWMFWLPEIMKKKANPTR